MAVSNIETHHPKYDEYRDSWQIMRDTVDGEDTVKDRGAVYLPMKSGVAAIDNKTLQAQTYLAYQYRAEFPELVAPTINGSAGIITEQPAKVTLPKKMEYLLEDVNGKGTTLAEFHKALVVEILTTGRYGVLPGPVDGGLFTLTGYTAERIINWDHDEQGRVNFVVLDETDQKRDPVTNVWSEQKQYLELSINDEGTYEALRYAGQVAGDPIKAMKPDQTPVTTVPFVFINTLGLQADPDDVPMYGLAKVSLRIYRLDADYMQGLHMTSEPTPWVNGFDDAKGAIDRGEVPTAIGAANLWILPKQATAGFLEFNGPGLEAQEKAILNALERAVMYGAQTLSENTDRESGRSRKMRMRGQQSLIRTIAVTAAQGLEKALRNIAVWLGEDPNSVVVTPFLDFVDFNLTAQELTALVLGWQSGAYSHRTLFENMQRADMIPKERSYEDEAELIETEGPPPNDPGNETEDPGGELGGDPASGDKSN